MMKSVSPAKVLKIIMLSLVSLAIVIFAGQRQAQTQDMASIKPSYLRVEYLVNPLGIDVTEPRLSWIVESGERAQKQSAYRILVAASKEALDADNGDLWDSGKVASGDTAQIVYKGKPLGPRTMCFWKVQLWDAQGRPSAWSGAAFWSMGLFSDKDWQAKWIGYDVPLSKVQKRNEKMKAYNRVVANSKVYVPCPFLRKSFNVDKPVKRATVYATALGLFELHLNGKRVGADYFTPGWTDYNKRVYYLTYDVTDMLRPGGENVLGAVLSDGWYAGNVGGLGQRVYGSKLRLKAQLEIEFQDGTAQVVAGDKSWKGNDGPIREDDIQDGETYDAQREMAGWSEPGFNAADWKSVVVTDKVSAQVNAYPGIPVRKTEEIKPISINEPKPGVFVYNLGQNFAGIARLKVKGKAGDKVVLRFAEMLNADGTVYTKNLRGARVIDTYILKGGGEEVWEPRFTFHGFQYVEVTGFPGKPDMDTITGIAMHSDLPEVSTFETSNPLVNKLYSNLFWGQRSNYFDVPTDCPQRDERLGWMGDAQAFVHTAAYNMDIAPFFTKWMVDVEDGQFDDGGYTDVSPAVLKGVTAGWGDAGVVCPWTIYKMYGDTRIIEKHYKSMDKWHKFLIKRSPSYLSPQLGGYGDWLNVHEDTDRNLITTAYYGHDTMLMSDMARAIEKNADADNDLKLFSNIRKSFTTYYMSNDGKIAGDTQTGYLMALRFGLIPDTYRKRAADHLVQKIKDRDWSLSTGFLGVSLLLPTLTDVGRTDVAYILLQNRKYPSWGYSIDQGATTIWERWNSYTKEKGFEDPGMNSFNHYAFGSVGEWMFATLAGIDTDGAGFKKIIIHPRTGDGIDWVKASYNSIRGEIATEWKNSDNIVTLNVTIPANTTATVYVPATNQIFVNEGNGLASDSTGVKFLRMETGAAVYEVGSGKYSFVSRMKNVD